MNYILVEVETVERTYYVTAETEDDARKQFDDGVDLPCNVKLISCEVVYVGLERERA